MCSLCRLPVAKDHNFRQILTLLGAPVPNLFYWLGPNLVFYSRPTVYVHLRNFFSIGLFYRPVELRKSQFLPFFGLRHLVVSPIGSSLRKLNTVHNYKPSPIERYQNRFCTPTPSWRNRAYNLWRSKAWRTDRQTDRQTKKLNALAAPAAGEIRAPPNLVLW